MPDYSEFLVAYWLLSDEDGWLYPGKSMSPVLSEWTQSVRGLGRVQSEVMDWTGPTYSKGVGNVLFVPFPIQMKNDNAPVVWYKRHQDVLEPVCWKDGGVEIVMLEKLDCILSKRATRPIYMKVQVWLNGNSPYQSQQSSPAIRDITVSGHTRHHHLRPYKTPSPAETCICNTPPLAIHRKARNKWKKMKQSDSHSSLLKTLREWAGKEYYRSLRIWSGKL